MSNSSTTQSSTKGWRFYINSKMLICVFMGFTSGLPLFVTLNLLQAWLQDFKVDLTSAGLFALVQFPYTWKFFWAPIMDRFVPSFGLWKPGRRRSWMLITSILVMITIAALGLLSPKEQIWLVAAMCSALAFFSASMDIVIDAYRRELLSDEQQGPGTALHVNAYRVSGLIPGALSLALADFLPWSQVFMITAAFMIPGIVTMLIIKEPTNTEQLPKTLAEAVVLPFREFLNRRGTTYALLILAFIFLYKLGDSMALALATRFYLDIGFTKSDIALIAKTVSFWGSLAGGFIGAIGLVKLGLNRGLWLFGLAQMISTAGFAVLAKLGAIKIALATVLIFESVSYGMGTAAFIAYIATITDIRYTATQFALFTSLSAIPRTFANATTGAIVDALGYFSFFLICTALAIPGLLLLFKIAPWNSRQQNQ